MSIETTFSEIQSRAAETVRATRRDRFFLGMAIALLIIVLLGFARTFFFRAFFAVPSIPAFDYVHALVQTSWFALLVAQASLVAAHRVDVHRRLGIAGAIVAILVAALSLAAVLSYPAHLAAGRVTTEGPAPNLAGFSRVVWTDLASIALFAAFVGIALVLRRRPEAHRRLMLLGSMAIISPAAIRMASLMTRILPGATHSVFDTSPALYLPLIFGLPLLLVLHDIWTRRRLHPATLVGVLAFFVAQLGASAVSFSAVGRALIKVLE